MKTFVQLKNSENIGIEKGLKIIGYIDGYVDGPNYINAIVVIPNLASIISVPINDILLLDVTDQKKYNLIFEK